MITTNIDGSSGSANQLFDLLSLISNPDAYSKKLKELQASIDEQKKFVELVGPASEIIALREKAKEDNESKAQALSDAKEKATSILSEAKVAASGILSDAAARAEQILAEANAKKDEITNTLSETKASLAAAKTAEAAAKTSQATANAKAKELSDILEATEKAKAEAEEAKAALLSKHQEFIQSL